MTRNVRDSTNKSVKKIAPLVMDENGTVSNENKISESYREIEKNAEANREEKGLTSPEIVYGPSEKKDNDFWTIVEDWYIWTGCWALMLLVFLGPVIFLMTFIIPKFWIFNALYICWLYYDSDTPHTGGRRFLFLRKLTFWRYRRDYFPIRLVKTAELPPDTTYLFSTFPHGILVFGASTNFASDVNQFDEAFPGLNPYIMTLNVNFSWPLTRDLLLGFGLCAASKKGLLNILQGPPGNVSVLVVGGVAEALKSLPGTYRLVLKNRKGFVKVALEAGSSLVPVFSFGETNTYDQISSEWYWWLQGELRSTTGIPLAIIKGRGIFGHSFRILPYKCPITTVVGKPIKLPKVENPSQKLIDNYHALFVDELTELFDEYKLKYDVNGEKATLVIE